MFIVGDSLITPPPTDDPTDKGRLIVVLSSWNLLMNGWRATKCGGALTIFIDATYCLVVEGHGTIGIFVVDESQKSHL